ncbi:hypothetical protein DF41_24820 [Raoultella planticola]|nr:hypothetical protein DF41_24820 [Raoultella planticola]
MTSKLTITRERLQEIAEDGFLKHGESKELARMALAAMDSEPVGEFYEDGPLNWYQISDGDRVPSHRRIPLYRHAQQLVVPTFEEWCQQTQQKPLGWVKDIMREAYDGCRAAMPAATPKPPGSDPATVPGGWIPVSERMPENDGVYLCWDNRYVTTYAFIFGAWQANQFIAKNITHWMPLPAAPQEVKGE